MECRVKKKNTEEKKKEDKCICESQPSVMMSAVRVISPSFSQRRRSVHVFCISSITGSAGGHIGPNPFVSCILIIITPVFFFCFFFSNQPKSIVHSQCHPGLAIYTSFHFMAWDFLGYNSTPQQGKCVSRLEKSLPRGETP